MGNRSITRTALALVVSLTSTAAIANECAVEVSSAIEKNQEMYINGAAGLANNNYSMRPGSYSSMACLDQFMQGGMDIFFRPPDLDSLLQQALSFACDQVAEVVQDSGITQGVEQLGLLSAASGGLKVPDASGGTRMVNMADFFQVSGGSSGGSLGTLFGEY